MHAFFSLLHHLAARLADADDFSWPHVAVHLIVEVGKGRRFARCGPGTFFLSDDDGRASPFVAGADDAVFRQDKH